MFLPRVSILSSLILLLFLYSCELDYDLGLDGDQGEEHPEIVMTGVRQVEVQGDQLIFVEAEKVEMFNQGEETRFINVSFQELDQNDQILRQGQAGEIRQYENDNLELLGDIIVEDLEEDSRVIAEELSWNDQERLLESPDDSTVTIEWDGLNSLGGQGFVGDFQRNELRFNRSIRGEFREDAP